MLVPRLLYTLEHIKTRHENVRRNLTKRHVFKLTCNLSQTRRKNQSIRLKYVSYNYANCISGTRHDWKQLF